MHNRITFSLAAAIGLLGGVASGGCASSVTEGLSSAVAHLAEAMLLSLFI